MCEKDTNGELFAVLTALDTWFQTIMLARHYHYEGEHPFTDGS